MIETGVLFNNIHSFHDLNLILSAVEISPAVPKTTYIDIPGGDGSLDLTEAHGEVKYSDRTIKLTLTMNPAGDLSETAWEQKKTEVSNALNGKACHITLDKDPDYYWQGRCTVDSYKSDKRLRQFVISGTVRPYKLKTEVTTAHCFCGKNLFNNSNLKLIGGSGCELSSIDTGVRAKWESGTESCAVVQSLPLDALIGKTVIISATITETGNTSNYLSIGYATADGKSMVAKSHMFVFGIGSEPISGSASTGLHIGEDAAGFDNLAVWFYANKGTADVEEGTYVDFTNVQIEIGNVATEYEPFESSAETKEIILRNSRKTVCPEITCDGEATLTANGYEITMGKGTHKYLDFQLHEGETPVTVSGTGTIVFVYQEGDL